MEGGTGFYMITASVMKGLMQHVDGEAKQALQVFSTNKGGYTMALKRIKYMLGQRSRIRQVYIAKMTRDKPISNDDDKSLLEFYYAMRLTLQRLPSKYLHKWAEYCFK